MTVKSDIDTGNANLYASYAGEFNSDVNGGLELLRSNEELDYSFDYTQDDSGFAINEVYSEFTVDELEKLKIDAKSTSSSNEYTIIKNSDICVILDSNNTVIGVKEGMPVAIDNLTQFSIKENSKGELEIISSPFANIGLNNKVRLDLHSRTCSSPEEVKLIKRLLGKE